MFTMGITQEPGRPYRLRGNYVLGLRERPWLSSDVSLLLGTNKGTAAVITVAG